MAGIVVVSKNSKGKIELTEEELQKMVNNAYEEGKRDAFTCVKPCVYRYEYSDKTPITVPSLDQYWKVTCCKSSDNMTLDTFTSATSNDE